MIAKTWQRSSTFQRALILFVIVLIGRLIFSVKTGLIDDEAYHWSWTKELALSYYDHPGFVAWAEAVSTRLLGDTPFAVRLPAFLAYVGTIVISWRLASELFNEAAAHFVAFLILFTPLWGLAGYVASPEPFLMFFWSLAAWIFWQGVRPDEDAWPLRKTWLALGIVMGLGLNSKFIMALLAPGFGLYLLMTPKHRKDLASPWPWTGVLIATLLCLPIFIWNHQVDWPGFRYQFHDRHQDGGVSFARWTAWLAAQVVFMSPFAYVLMAMALVKSWLLRQEARWRFLFALAAPALVVFYPQAYLADAKPHWAGPAYLILALGAGSLWASGWSTEDRKILKPRSKVFAIGILAFLVPINLLFYSSLATPWVPKAFRWLNPGKEWTTTWDVSNEFTGWEELGDFVNRRQREIHAETGKRPFVAALRYETTAQTYWGTKQKTRHLSFTRSHYTVMQKLTNDLENLKGLDALIVTTEKYPAQPVEWGFFDVCTSEELKTYRGSEHARTFTVWWCRNFQGIR